MSTPRSLTRRAMLAAASRACAAAAVALAVGNVALPARRAQAAVPAAGKHPDPRPGIDASHILADDKVREHGEDALAAFAEARQIPEILDGIRCNCGCADEPGMRSLLTCYEDDGMAMHCHICQGQARLAFKLHQRGRTLDQIRAAVDARFGS